MWECLGLSLCSFLNNCFHPSKETSREHRCVEVLWIISDIWQPDGCEWQGWASGLRLVQRCTGRADGVRGVLSLEWDTHFVIL